MENVVGSVRPQVIIKIYCMCIACWIPKATDTRSEYVTVIALPLQRRLHECASILRYTYMACLVWYLGYGSVLVVEICVVCISLVGAGGNAIKWFGSELYVKTLM